MILFLAANPRDTGRLGLDREARAIHVELRRSGYRDRFDFATRWAAEPLDLLREVDAGRNHEVDARELGCRRETGAPIAHDPHRCGEARTEGVPL